MRMDCPWLALNRGPVYSGPVYSGRFCVFGVTRRLVAVCRLKRSQTHAHAISPHHPLQGCEPTGPQLT